METVLETAWKTWSDGGWLMMPLSLLGLFIYTSILDIYFSLDKLVSEQSDINRWSAWVDRLDEAKGPIGEMVRYVREEVLSDTDIRRRIQQLRSLHLSGIDGRLRMASVFVGTAPLAGLLGTVTGMLTTFAGLGASSGGNTIDLVAGGISEALITTQTGLVLAIPGYVLLNLVKRRREKFEVFLNQLEIVAMQSFQRQRHLRAS